MFVSCQLTTADEMLMKHWINAEV